MKYILLSVLFVFGLPFAYGALLIIESFDTPPQNAQTIGTGIFVDEVNKNLSGTLVKNNIHAVQRYALPVGRIVGKGDSFFFDAEIIIHDSEPNSDVNVGLFNSALTNTNERHRLTIAFRHLSGGGRFFYLQVLDSQGGLAQIASWSMPGAPDWDPGQLITMSAHYDSGFQRFFATFTPEGEEPFTMSMNVGGGAWFVDSIGVGNSDGAAGPGKSATFSVDTIRFSDMPFPPPDFSPPTVSIISPRDGDVVSGTIFIHADATDDIGVSSVQFFVDTLLHGQDILFPYDIAWDTTLVSDGTHTITAEAHDEAGHSTVSEPIMVTVRNAIPVMIDIKPGSDENSINLASKGLLPVAVLGEEHVDVCQIDVSSIRFANTAVALKKNGEYMASFEDIDDDGFLDVVLHFKISSLKLDNTDTDVLLEGRTFDGKIIEGNDSIRPI